MDTTKGRNRRLQKNLKRETFYYRVVFFYRLLLRSSTRTFHYFLPPPPSPSSRHKILCDNVPSKISIFLNPCVYRRFHPLPLPLAFVCIQSSPACECHFLPKTRLPSRIRWNTAYVRTFLLGPFSSIFFLVLRNPCSFFPFFTLSLSLSLSLFVFLSHSRRRGPTIDWASLFCYFPVRYFPSSLCRRFTRI